MKRISHYAATSAVALVLAASVAHGQAALVGTEALDDRIDDITEAAADDFARSQDSKRYGNPDFVQGWNGSISATYSGVSGNSKTQDLSVAGRLKYGQGPWNHTFGIALEFGEDTDVDTGVTSTNKEKAFLVYDVNRSLNDKLYIFGLGRYQQDEFADTKDAFIGIGPGYRVINTEDLAWRVQAGPGVRYSETAGVETTEAAAIVSSRLFYRFNDTIFLTNDTDVLGSDVGYLASNDLGLNVGLSNNLSTRISYLTEFNSEPAAGKKHTDNTFGVSLVYSFN